MGMQAIDGPSVEILILNLSKDEDVAAEPLGSAIQLRIMPEDSLLIERDAAV